MRDGSETAISRALMARMSGLNHEFPSSSTCHTTCLRKSSAGNVGTRGTQGRYLVPQYTPGTPVVPGTEGSDSVAA